MYEVIFLMIGLGFALVFSAYVFRPRNPLAGLSEDTLPSLHATSYRQGDVLLQRVRDHERPTFGAITIDRSQKAHDDSVVLAYGEATGHAHRLEAEGGVDYYKNPANDDVMLIEVKETALLRHEEHRSIEVPPGTYRVIRQREWSEDDQYRYVAD